MYIPQKCNAIMFWTNSFVHIQKPICTYTWGMSSNKENFPSSAVAGKDSEKRILDIPSKAVFLWNVGVTRPYHYFKHQSMLFQPTSSAISSWRLKLLQWRLLTVLSEAVALVTLDLYSSHWTSWMCTLFNRTVIASSPIGSKQQWAAPWKNKQLPGKSRNRKGYIR